MKTDLNAKITNSAEAKAYIIALFNNDESYHPEDDAFDIVWAIEESEEPTEGELNQLNANMELVYKVAAFDPCELLNVLLEVKNNDQNYNVEGINTTAVEAGYEIPNHDGVDVLVSGEMYEQLKSNFDEGGVFSYALDTAGKPHMMELPKIFSKDGSAENA